MKNRDEVPLDILPKTKPQEGGLDPLAILSVLLNNWYYFVIAIVVTFFIARIYISHSFPIYRVWTTILINEERESSAMNNDKILQGMGLPGGMRNLDNQIMILASRDLTERALKKLSFEVEFYTKTIRNKLPIYPLIPIKIVSDAQIPLPRNTEFLFEYQGNNNFKLDSEDENFIFHKQVSFGDSIFTSAGSFRIERGNNDWLNNNLGTKLYFVINDPNSVVRYFNARLRVDLISKTGSILRISLEGPNKTKDVEFLNKLVEVFQDISLDRKNAEAERRIQFIDGQLIGITDSLSITENKLQQFRSTHKVMDLSAQGQAIIAQSTVLENERVRLSLESQYYDYLANYLSKETPGETLRIPITMGITDPGLTRLVTELITLQDQLSSRGASEMNPLQNIIVQKINASKDALRETLNGLRRANTLAISENQRQITRLNTQASTLPVTERQLLGIERKFKLNDELYTYLLEKRAEQEMQKASNMADSEVIDPADERIFSIIAPNPSKIYFLALVIGFGIPFAILFLGFLFNKKLKYEEIGKVSDIPIIGNITHNPDKHNTVVFDNPNSAIAEAFRLLRTRMQFFIKDTKSPVILVTSSMPGDGKTFTAINLASAYSLLGKKTVLVGFDLRKPKIFKDFNLDNEKGVSTWLIGKDPLQDIIKETSYENLSIISAGPIPPNPSELTSLEKTNQLFELLKEKYDYILIDSSPIGIVSDTVHLASIADSCLLVVRPKKTIREMFRKSIYEIQISNLKGVSLVINDIQSEGKHYGYGEQYGYTDDSNHRRIKLLKKTKMKYRKG